MGLKVGTVKIEAYNENWKLMFKEEKENLIKVFGDIALQIEHIGSTSIPGLSAKPIIDILVVLESFNEFEKVKDYFKDEPYSIKEDSPSDEILVRKRITIDVTTHLIHIMEANTKRCTNTILFKDYLINHPKKLKEYEELKKDLAEKYADNRKMYTASKNDFIQEVLKAAEKSV